MPIPKEISVLGTKYKVEISTPEKDESLSDSCGYTDRSSKRIAIDDLHKQDIKSPLDDVNYDMEATFRHELFHALFHEAGLDKYSKDEELVDALSILAPKIKEYL